MSDNKMTAEQALDAVRNVLQRTYNAAQPVCCGRPGLECCGSPVPEWSEDDEQLMSDLQPVEAYLSQALSAPRVPESIDRLREASAKGFSTSKSCGPDGKYQSVTEFRSLSDLQDYERARIALLAASPEPVAPQPVCAVCGKRSIETGNNGQIVVCPACRHDDPTAPAAAQHGQQVIADLRAEVEALKAKLRGRARL